MQIQQIFCIPVIFFLKRSYVISVQYKAQYIYLPGILNFTHLKPYCIMLTKKKNHKEIFFVVTLNPITVSKFPNRTVVLNMLYIKWIGCIPIYI